jgi:MFS transporter, DHA1 family, tetracycline resistance protein
VYGLFVLPESLPREKRQPQFDWAKANPLGALVLLSSHPELMGLAAVNFLTYLAHEVYMTVFVLYVMYRYAWSQRAVGWSLAVVGVASMIVSGLLVGPAVKWFGERRSLFVGLLFGAAGFVLFGWAPAGWIFLAGIAVNALWSLSGPPSQSLMTRRVSASEQGQLQGALASLRGIAMVIGPGMFSGTFAYFIAGDQNFPGAPWYLAALLLVAAFALAWAVAPKPDRETGGSEELAEEGAVG